VKEKKLELPLRTLVIYSDAAGAAHALVRTISRHNFPQVNTDEGRVMSIDLALVKHNGEIVKVHDPTAFAATMKELCF
jgi:hypothetical protein